MWLCKYDLSKECEGKYKDCTNCILDQIRSEIKALTDGAEPELIWNVDVFAIIDKYKAESEDDNK